MPPAGVRESLPQSFHLLAVSEPDPITLFTPYILSVSCLSNDRASSYGRTARRFSVSAFLQQNPHNFFSGRRRPKRTEARHACSTRIFSILSERSLHNYITRLASV